MVAEHLAFLRDASDQVASRAWPPNLAGDFAAATTRATPGVPAGPEKLAYPAAWPAATGLAAATSAAPTPTGM